MPIPEGGIAFFDSGIGGLTVMNACRKFFHDEIFYYYGDNARAPYGNLSCDIIYAHVREAFQSFQALRVKAAVIACNTATAVCIDRLRAEFSFPIIGVEPCVATVAKKGGDVYVLTTRATHESARYKSLCARVSAEYPNSVVYPFACDGLAGEIERHIFDRDHDFSEHFPKGAPSAVALGCTHYVYIKDQIERFYGCKAFDGNDGVARRLRDELQKVSTLEEKENFYEKTGEKRPLKTTPNNCSGDFWEKRPKSTKNPPFFQLFWLGSGKKINKTVNEQMFALKNWAKN